jgi:transposase
MFVRIKTHPNSLHKQIQICRSVREGAKTRQKVVRHIGTARNENEVEELKSLAVSIKTHIEEEERKAFYQPIKMPDQKAISDNQVNFAKITEKARYIEGFHEIFGKLFHQVGINEILPSNQIEVLLDVILARIATPCSKSKTRKMLAVDFGKDISLDRIYRMMDSLVEKKDKIQKKVFKATQELSDGEVDVLLFDVTTLFFESIETDELREFGFSKDQKFHTTQVVLALATTSEGLPVGYRLFPGDTAEVSTLIACLSEWKRVLPIGKVIFVGDRAMMSESNLALLEESKISYVIAAKLKKMKGSIQQQILQGPKQKEETDKAYQEIILPNGRRLIATHSLSREQKDKKDRERGLERVKKKLGKGKSLKRLIPNYGYQKYVKIEGDGKVQLDDEKIRLEECWDGFHGVLSNCLETDVDELLSHYRRLWVIEESFRIQKHTLRMRPIYHFKPERIEAHILICYIAFSLMRYLENKMAKEEVKISMEEMREALWSVQVSLLYDEGTNRWYKMPSHFEDKAQLIYRAMGIPRTMHLKACSAV